VLDDSAPARAPILASATETGERDVSAGCIYRCDTDLVDNTPGYPVAQRGGGFLFAVTARMVLGLVFRWLAIRLSATRVPWHARARRAYLAAGAGIYGAMLLGHWLNGEALSTGVWLGASLILIGLGLHQWDLQRRLS
jgi:hypothetical protein